MDIKWQPCVCISVWISCKGFISLHARILFYAFVVICWLFKINFFKKLFSETPSEFQTVWIQIRNNIMLGLIWVHSLSVCRDRQQTTKFVPSKERVIITHGLLKADISPFGNSFFPCQLASDSFVVSGFIFWTDKKSSFSQTFEFYRQNFHKILILICPVTEGFQTNFIFIY